MKFAKSALAFLPGLLGTLVWFSPRLVEAGENLWTSHGPPGPVQELAAAPVDPRTIYAGSHQDAEGRVFKSADGGETWEILSPGSLSFSDLTCLAVDPTQGATVYAGKIGGEFLSSHDGGAHWESQIIDPRAQSTAIVVDPATSAIYLGGTTDEWASPENYADPVFKSTDGGGTWRATALAKPHNSYTLLADALKDTLLVGTDFAYFEGYLGYGLFGRGGNVARTADGGATWAFGPVDLGSPVLSLAKDTQGSVYFAGTQAGHLYRSMDGGATWGRLSTLPGTVSALAVDPADSSVLYAATPNRGVLRSTDGGANWSSFNAGMATRSVTSLTIDSTGQVLHVGTNLGVFDMAIAAVPGRGPCAPGGDHLCFFGSRFRLNLTAIDPFTKTPFATHAVSGNDQSGYFTFPSLTGDATFPEVMVKMVDATSLAGGGYWVFYAGMTSVLYTLEITDTTTGQSRQYSGEDSCGGADPDGFLPGASAIAGVSTRTSLSAVGLASEPDLELLNGRFRVTLVARNPATDTEAPGQAIPQDDRFGSFSLPAFTGNPDLPEVFVKMLDAGGGSFLFFYTGLTTLDYSVTVLDTVTETAHTYSSEGADPRRPCGAGQLLMFAE